MKGPGFSKYYYYLMVVIREEVWKEETERALIHWFTLQMATVGGLGQSQSQSKESNAGGWQEPSSLSPQRYLPEPALASTPKLVLKPRVFWFQMQAYFH